MKLMQILAATVSLTAMASPIPAYVHTSIDSNRPITLVGTVTRIELRNPRSYLYLDVKGKNGQVTTWSVDTGHQANMIPKLKGSSRDWMQGVIGTTVTISAFQDRERQNHTGSLSGITFADGSKIESGSGQYNHFRIW